MTAEDFRATVEQELRSRRVPFASRDLIAFVEAAWPAVEDPPDRTLWADEFLASRLVTSRG